ncbi:MAG: DUF4315 family protein [Clostridiales bacterium]|nr:DUF4315 family protein [Clostridiales bacterium]
MSAKLDKMRAEREKARQKRDEWDRRFKEWDQKYREQENTEICDVTHSYNLTPDQLAELLRMVKETMPETAQVQETTKSFYDKEEEAHED